MSASKNIWAVIQDMPPYAKAALVLESLTVFTVVGFKVYGGIKKKIDQKKNDQKANETIAASNQQATNLQNQGMQPTYSDAQYKSWADAADSCYQGWGTCTGDTIFVNLKNDLDMLKLIQAFGIRTIGSGKFNPAPDFRGDLPAVLRDELSSSEIASVNAVLAKNGLSYRF